jgi:hypothetical protein
MKLTADSRSARNSSKECLGLVDQTPQRLDHLSPEGPLVLVMVDHGHQQQRDNGHHDHQGDHVAAQGVVTPARRGLVRSQFR